MAAIALPALAAAAATGAYLDARFGFSNDIRQIRHERTWNKSLEKRLTELDDTCSLYGMFQKVDPELDALWFEGRTWSYRELKADADKLVTILRNYDIKADDFVAVFTANSPEMVIICLALSKLGAVAALINTNLRDETFTHCINVSKAKLIISTPDFATHVICPIPHITLNLYSFDNVSVPASSVQATSGNISYLNPSTSLWQSAQPDILPPAPRTLSDFALLIYTSGTTGKPKACAIRQSMCIITANTLTSDLDDPTKYFPLRTYSALPLFHGTAFFTGVCYVIGNSGCICLRRKFSATNFFRDVAESKATRILYIGELCRYLLASPPSPFDKAHQCIVAHGNGLRGEIWEEFKVRFNIPEIREFYRSTEGKGKFDNHGFGSQRAGKVGFQGPLMRRYENATFIVKFDVENERPWRDPKTGFCVLAKTGEAGEVLGRVPDRNGLTEYLGNESATQEKLLSDVFVKGDLFQRMGDLLLRDSDGWVRFADRIGDTFRWKGENVSAGEVRDHICEADEVEDAVVYGVKLRNYDGQAGGAAITLKTDSPENEARLIGQLHQLLRKKGVPTYAVPRLVRFTQSIGSGVTFKQAKGDLLKKSWSPSEQTGHPESLYWLDGTKYKKLDDQSWQKIDQGVAKL